MNKYSIRLIVFSITCLFFISCGGGNHSDIGTAYLKSDLSNVFVYSKKGTYARNLVSCAKAKNNIESCPLKILPLIGLEKGSISITKIMQRVVVSHRWMGDRFKQLLEMMPVKTLQLFNSVTMIIIDDDVRPSFYWTMTGAVYIDPSYLWVSNKEKSDINKKNDYRKNYGKDLSLIAVSRYVKNNQRVYQPYSLNDKKERTVNDIKYSFFRLIFHELAHANDFCPPNIISSLNKNTSIVYSLNKINKKRISNLLYQSYPLRSSELKKIGQVLYQGKTATSSQKQTTPLYAGSLMHNDSANHMYSYSTKYEDLAMLFEAVLMKKYFSIEMDIGFTNKPNKINPTCKEYIIGWGSRNRLANPVVKIRAKQVVQHMFNVTNWDDFFNDEVNGVGIEVFLQTGVDWCSILDAPKKRLKTFDKAYIMNDFLGFPE